MLHVRTAYNTASKTSVGRSVGTRCGGEMTETVTNVIDMSTPAVGCDEY